MTIRQFALAVLVAAGVTLLVAQAPLPGPSIASGSVATLGANTFTGSQNITGQVIATGNISAGANSFIFFTNRSAFMSPADGIMLVQNQAGTDFTRLQLGGTTSAFPAVKRFGNASALRLADDTVPVFSALTACAAGGEGAMVPVSDSTTQIWGATITGGGALHALAYCDGSAWTVAAK